MKRPRTHKYFGPNREQLHPQPSDSRDLDKDKALDEDEGIVDNKDLEQDENLDKHVDSDMHAHNRRKIGNNNDDNDLDDELMWNGVSNGSSTNSLFINDRLETLFDKNKPNDIDAEEAKVITNLRSDRLQQSYSNTHGLRFDPSDGLVLGTYFTFRALITHSSPTAFLALPAA
jgi:hypothetical protein